MNKRKRALWGFIIGDAYGVPMEFMERDSFNVRDMIGYGCWDVPAGTWSDDSAMTLITIEHLINDTSIADLKRAYCNWAFRGYWTYNDEPSFDVGLTIAEVLNRWENNGIYEIAKTDEQSNGNGALMRILPICFYLWYGQFAAFAELARMAEDNRQLRTFGLPAQGIRRWRIGSSPECYYCGNTHHRSIVNIHSRKCESGEGCPSFHAREGLGILCFYVWLILRSPN